MHYVYVIQDQSSGRIKIGHSKNPQQRLEKLRLASGLHLILVQTHKYANKGVCSYVEREAHKELSRFRELGEWFSKEALAAIPKSAFGPRDPRISKKKSRRVWHPVKMKFVEIELT